VYKALSATKHLSLLQHEFAMAILDVQMPGMNGFELAELMRGTEKTKNIPIIRQRRRPRTQLRVQGLRERAWTSCTSRWTFTR
jgi:CheY-like chemotaxis protein